MNADLFLHPPYVNRKGKYIHKEDHLFEYARVRVQKDDLYEVNKLLKMLNRNLNKVLKKHKTFSNPPATGKKETKNSYREQNQRVISKIWRYYTAQSHDRFVKYYMPQLSKDNVLVKPDLFGMSEEDYDKVKIPFHYRWIVSPENPNVNLKTLSENLIKRIEYLTGYKLAWRGVIHTDTGHPHAHLVINGMDLTGKSILLPKDLIIKSREICGEEATVLIGPRTDKEMEFAEIGLYHANRFTKLDEIIENRKNLSRISLSQELDNRLSYLCTINLAHLDRQNQTYQLEDNWKDILIRTGRYNSYLVEYLRNPDINFYSGGKIEGVVKKTITMAKDESWNDALIIESEGKEFFVPVWQLNKENLENRTVLIDKPQSRNREIKRTVRDRDIRLLR